MNTNNVTRLIMNKEIDPFTSLQAVTVLDSSI